MKKFLVLLSLHSFFIIHHSFSQSPNWFWAKKMGGIGYDSGSSIAMDASGNVYTTGFFMETVDFDPGAGTFNLTTAAGTSGIFISKLDGSGNFVWAKEMVGTIGGQGYSIAIDTAGSGNVYIAGAFVGTIDFDPGVGIFNLTATGQQDIFISKLDNSGNFVWAKAIGGSDFDRCYSIALDPAGSGDVYATGFFLGTADFDPGIGTFNLISAGQQDIFISKLNSSGNFVWAKAIGGTGYDDADFITLDPAGNGDIYTTGFFTGTVDFDPGAGTFYLNTGGNFISKLNSSGNFVWAITMAGCGKAIVLDPTGSGDVYSLGGNFISKLSISGNLAWTKPIGGSGNAIAFDPAGGGNIYITGDFDGTADFDPGMGTFNLSGYYDIFFSKLDASGNFVWAKSAGGTDQDYCQGLALDVYGNVHVTGQFQSPTITFGSTTLINVDSTGYIFDIFIAKLDHITGIESVIHKDGFSVFPNPSNGKFTIDMNEMQNPLFNRQHDISIYNVPGEKIYSTTINSQSSIINLDAPNGIYFLHIKTENDSVTQKLIIQK